MPIGTQLLQHTVYRYQGLVWVDDIDLVWIIIATPFGSHITWHRSLSRIVMIPSGIYRQRSLSRTVIVPSGTYSYFPYPLLRYLQT